MEFDFEFSKGHMSAGFEWDSMSVILSSHLGKTFEKYFSKEYSIPHIGFHIGSEDSLFYAKFGAFITPTIQWEAGAQFLTGVNMTLGNGRFGFGEQFANKTAPRVKVSPLPVRE